jgi:hypothetical protein
VSLLALAGRRSSAPPTEAVDDWVVFCKAASVDCTNPANWTDELRLTPSSFNMLNAPFANGLFVGDYMGLAAAGLDAWAVFGTAELPNHTAEFVRHIMLPGPVASNQ